MASHTIRSVRRSPGLTVPAAAEARAAWLTRDGSALGDHPIELWWPQAKRDAASKSLSRALSSLRRQSEPVVSFKENPQQKQVFAIQGRWFPEAFGGSMGKMMTALTEGREPQTSGRDNLNSIRIAYAAVESAATGRAVELAECE